MHQSSVQTFESAFLKLLDPRINIIFKYVDVFDDVLVLKKCLLQGSSKETCIAV